MPHAPQANNEGPLPISSHRDAPKCLSVILESLLRRRYNGHISRTFSNPRHIQRVSSGATPTVNMQGIECMLILQKQEAKECHIYRECRVAPQRQSKYMNVMATPCTQLPGGESGGHTQQNGGEARRACSITFDVRHVNASVSCPGPDGRRTAFRVDGSLSFNKRCVYVPYVQNESS